MIYLNHCFERSLRPGDLIVTSMGNYEHHSIVSDRWCPSGKRMLISATSRTGTVMEEPYDAVVQNRKTGHAPRQSDLPAHIILENARSQIGKWRYQALTQNCETFANWAAGLQMSSRQVNGLLLGALIGLVATKSITQHPSTTACILVAAFGGVIGLASAQALK